MEDREKLTYIFFNHLGFVGPSRFKKLIDYFGSAYNAYQASPSELQKIGWSLEYISRFSKLKESFNGGSRIKKLERDEINVVTIKDDLYPKNLLQISDPPYLLYIRGTLLPSDDTSISIVGSRKMTNYGQQVIENIIPELVASNLTIVSGLAFGVDIAVQKAAIDSGGRVVAVLASGVDLITPRAHEEFVNRFIKMGSGAVISELPPGTAPLNYFFPIRNRIISGFSMGTVVIEATANSGTFHTVSSAVDQGREVFAVPGSIFNPLSVGTTRLLNQGAKLVCSAADILQELNFEKRPHYPQVLKKITVSGIEKDVLSLLSEEARSIDSIARRLNLGAGEIGSVLMTLELEGYVSNVGNGIYRATNS